jgi:N-methylhydantoinase A/oxoprolinase/acetone carboxylase beta subunit
VYDGARLPVGASLAGPLIVELPHTSVVVDSGQRVRKDALGGLSLSLR